MKKQNPLEKNLAERIAQEEFNKEHEHHDFSSKYQKKKAAFLTTANQEKKFTWNAKKIVMAAVALVIIIPIAGFTTNKIYQWYATQDAYKTTISIDNQAGYNDKFYQLDFGYLPSNMTGEDNKYSYDDNPNMGGFSFTLWKVPGHAEFTQFNTKDYTEETFGENKAYLIERQENYFSQGVNSSKIVYLSFEKEGYVLEAYVGDDVPKEDLEKVLSQVSLKETTKENATYSLDYSDMKQYASNNPLEKGEINNTKLPLNSPNLVEIGQSVTVAPWGDSKSSTVNFVVDSVGVYDTVKGFDTTNFNTSFFDEMKEKNLLSDDLDLKPYTQRTIKRGDGETTTDEIVGKQLVTPKFVYVTATIQNTSDSELEGLSLQNAPILLEEQDDKLVHIDNTNEQVDITARNGGDGGVDYLDNHGEGKSYYQMPTFQANEKRTIHFGFFVDDNQLDKLILPVFNYSDPDDLKNDNYYWVDIRQ